MQMLVGEADREVIPGKTAEADRDAAHQRFRYADGKSGICENMTTAAEARSELLPLFPDRAYFSFLSMYSWMASKISGPQKVPSWLAPGTRISSASPPTSV